MGVRRRGSLLDQASCRAERRRRPPGSWSPSLLATRRSCWRPRLAVAGAVLQHAQHGVETCGRGLQLGERVGNQLLGLGKLVGVVERVLLEPLEAVEFVAALLDLADVESMPAVVVA